MEMNMQQLTKSNYFDSIKNGAVVVEFKAPWCGDCRRIEPIMQKAQNDFKDKIVFFSVDFGNEPDLKDSLQIRRIPTLIFYKNGKEVGERLVEPSSPAVINNALSALL